MIVHPKRRVRQEINIPMTSLIDMVFLLLIYFLLTTNFLTDEGLTIKLPRANSGAPHVDEILTIDIDHSGKIFIGSQQLSTGQLFSELKKMIKDTPDKIVVVKADRSIELEKAVKVLDLAKAAGARRLSLATEKDL